MVPSPDQADRLRQRTKELGMPMNERDIQARDRKRDIGAELLEAVHRVKAGDVGKVHMVPARSHKTVDRMAAVAEQLRHQKPGRLGLPGSHDGAACAALAPTVDVPRSAPFWARCIRAPC